MNHFRSSIQYGISILCFVKIYDSNVENNSQNEQSILQKYGNSHKITSIQNCWLLKEILHSKL
ncbi:hypothetical protein [Leptospira kirschneri]|uniref:Uncharacterized protein n=2 Tax=Leptospira kirschneri TaxID=29507 RepID=A0A0E2BIL0_9LEPT|nr:hypothetical protein [Leptospira kirschneri]EMO75043.1 hypothetical protein LEP1GSC127_0416 [Leptospira kirschneri str. 200801925]EJO67996.1 hypothetical protein LEP1GSC044_0426 [Leptospira kirschneri serovar Grippotyphosa str. RM52]EKO17118.1 hypothetical protein LEP1GSC081_4354 [Leptospira kirschneri str. H1]EKQ85698.1 hypothetical protein LEP1GSC064_0552 [Leptospira kirschneri serovar Grippotyphosa str. Moskva]EKR09203.1 hypothetical protein LEP1GSC122_0160 [Leptospira kirschneri serovar